MNKIIKLLGCVLLVGILAVVSNAQASSDPLSSQPTAAFTTDKTVNKAMTCVSTNMLRKGWQPSTTQLDGGGEAIILAGPFGSIAAAVEARPSQMGTTVTLHKKHLVGTYVEIIKQCL